MEKKTEIKKEGIIIAAQKAPHKLYSIWLTPCDWKKLFTKEEYYLIMTESLNSTVYNDKMILNGYLLTHNSLCLILDNDEENCHRVLLAFFERVKKSILQHRKKKYHKEESIKLSRYYLFKKHSLNNPALVKLLTGTPVNLPYYDPQLARLENKLQEEPFCSVIDYSGAVGPVIIKKLSKKATVIIIDIEMVSIESEYLTE